MKSIDRGDEHPVSSQDESFMVEFLDRMARGVDYNGNSVPPLCTPIDGDALRDNMTDYEAIRNANEAMLT